MTEQFFPAAKGSYLLWLYLRRGHEIEIGKLGPHCFSRGWYFYCGSAFGPGGLQARLNHHLNVSPRTHWHIDYLKVRAEIRSVWLCRGVNLEHDWSRMLLTLPGALAPVPGFGSSDCNCLSHLVYLRKRPAIKVMRDCLVGDSCIESFCL